MPMPVAEESNDPALVLTGEEPSGEILVVDGADKFDFLGLLSSDTGGDTGPPIIVNGYRVNAGGGAGGAGGGGTGFFDNDPMTVTEQMFNPDDPNTYPTPDEPDDYDPPKVAARCRPENVAKCTEAAQKITDAVVQLTPIIESLADEAKIQLADGSTISGRELKEMWKTIDFLITDDIPTEYASGSLDRVNGIATLFADGVLAGSPINAEWMIMHEVAHYSAAGTVVDKTLTDAWWNANHTWVGWEGSPGFKENEEYANVGARNILTALGVYITDGWVPLHGYEYGDPS